MSAQYPNSNRNAAKVRIKGKWVDFELSRWRIKYPHLLRSYCENHLKPMIDELKRQEQEEE